ncbi:uncharacterized protein LOC111518369 [Drosophila willistoni]|uniref:uncharacterized protein LOC111518369 n=1 Tax=Drosophila willistoni TaxID=7260 RepID=UPI000C26D01C|nr:uncharacterized protein LOC111518369 [Drosophila willistoni]
MKSLVILILSGATVIVQSEIQMLLANWAFNLMKISKPTDFLGIIPGLDKIPGKQFIDSSLQNLVDGAAGFRWWNPISWFVDKPTTHVVEYKAPLIEQLKEGS